MGHIILPPEMGKMPTTIFPPTGKCITLKMEITANSLPFQEAYKQQGKGIILFCGIRLVNRFGRNMTSATFLLFCHF